MQHNKYSGRITVILVVLFISLFGLGPLWPGGIFPFDRLFNSEIPWSKKANLKPGIDIKGGISLLYEIQAPSSGARESLAADVAESLKKRVDPEGVKNLVWRPQGATKIEIQMPMGENTDKNAQIRREFTNSQNELAATNIQRPAVEAALNLSGPARDQRLDELAMGSPVRKSIFDKLKPLHDRWKDLSTKTDEESKKQKVDVTDEMNALYDELAAKTNIDVRAFQAQILDGYQVQIDKARNNRQSSVETAKIKERDAAIAKIRETHKEFPLRVKALDHVVSSFDAYARVRGSLDDAEDLKRLLRGSGVLEFHILYDPSADSPPSPAERATAESMIQRLQPGREGPLPRADDVMRFYEVDDPEQIHGRPIWEWGGKHWSLAFITPAESMVHREGQKPWGLERASKGFDQRTNEQIVEFEFDPQGAYLFGELSGSHLKKPLAIVLDDKLISAPTLIARIESHGQITGHFSDADINYLVRTLNAGSLPAKLADEPISERIVSPTLGADNLKAGFTSCIIGLVVVLIFLLGYYYRLGAVAFLAVALNMVIILGVLASFHATFTLPGIAGLILTLGAAVDANVLIFERLREEEHRGLSLRMAIRNAYDRAFSAILDSNVITIITSLILYYFGSEEVRGFGLTLLIGIASSLFTALYVTRVIFDIMVEKYGVTNLGSLPLTFPKWDKFLKPNIDWMGKVGWFVALSVIILVAGVAAFFTEGRNMFDIEFVSGTSIQFELKEPATRQQVMNWIQTPQFEKAIPSPQIVAVGGAAAGKEYELVTPNAHSAEVKDALTTALREKLNIEVNSRFHLVEAPFEQAYVEKVVRPANTEAAASFEWAKNEIIAHAGGVVVSLTDLDPPLTPRQIGDRIERARLQAGMPYRKLQVVTPADPEKPASTALVLVAEDTGAGAETDEAKWQEQLGKPIWKVVTEAINRPPNLQKVSTFDPQVARGFLYDALGALIVSIILVMVYIWLRFGNVKYGSATVVAMLHDVIIVIGAIGLSHYLARTWFGQHILLLEPFRMNLTLVAAVLTVMGYSMIDTIVVFDRIRENRGKFGYVSRQVINDSINQTLSRTLLTAGTTIVTVFVMYVFGGPGIHGFTFALLVGILVGTYSSIAIAAPLLLLGGKDVQPAAAGVRQPPVAKLQRVARS